MSKVTVMATDGTRHGGQAIAIGLLSCAVAWVLIRMVLRFDVIDIVPFAFIMALIFSTLTREAARAGSRLVMTMSLVFMVGLLGLGSAGALAHSGVHLSAITDLASVGKKGHDGLQS